MDWSITIPVYGQIGALAVAALAGGLTVFILLRPKFQKLVTLASRDDLTGLYNSREFKRRLREEMERAKRYNRPLSLVLLDIDHFKGVNDAYGYVAGDLILQEFAGFMRSHVRVSDIMFRYKQGDEFAILAVETGLPGARALVERLRTELRTYKFQVEGRRKRLEEVPVSIGMSAGIAAFRLPADTIDTFIERAEGALDTAKRAARGIVLEEEVAPSQPGRSF